MNITTNCELCGKSFTYVVKTTKRRFCDDHSNQYIRQKYIAEHGLPTPKTAASGSPSPAFLPPAEHELARKANSAEARMTSGRRRLVDPATCDRDYSDADTEFMFAMEKYKKLNRRPFPTWSEALEVLRSLGYRQVEQPTALPSPRSATTAETV